MVDPAVVATDDSREEPIETVALVDEQTPDAEANEPVICDPVIGFICPSKAMTRAGL